MTIPIFGCPFVRLSMLNSVSDVFLFSERHVAVVWSGYFPLYSKFLTCVDAWIGRIS